MTLALFYGLGFHLRSISGLKQLLLELKKEGKVLKSQQSREDSPGVSKHKKEHLWKKDVGLASTGGDPGRKGQL